MFSINPFIYDYSRPKSYSLFDDDYCYPFSSNGYYVRDQPLLFRTSSFRRPQSCYQPSYQLSRNQQQEKCKPQFEQEDEFDPFLDLFNLRSPTRNRCQVKSNDNIKSNNQVKSNDKRSNEAKQKSEDLKKPSIVQEKWLDSQRFDKDNVIEFKLNYKCDSPSGIDVKITKDNYIILKTVDNYIWKSRIPDDVDVYKATCTMANGQLSLKLPKVVRDVQMKEDDNHQVKKDDNEKKQDGKSKETKVNESDKKDEEFDPDAPIVEDVYED